MDRIKSGTNRETSVSWSISPTISLIPMQGHRVRKDLEGYWGLYSFFSTWGVELYAWRYWCRRRDTGATRKLSQLANQLGKGMYLSKPSAAMRSLHLETTLTKSAMDDKVVEEFQSKNCDASQCSIILWELRWVCLMTTPLATFPKLRTSALSLWWM